VARVVVTTAEESAQSALAAGDFSMWLTAMQGALRGENGSDVPCDGCTACCTSSQFVHIEPDEIDTLSHIPAELLFAAPRLPPGHVLLGYDERGHCPMLKEGRCSIYDHRPRTCRTYDCRVFPAAGIDGDEDKVQIRRRARRWEFAFPTVTDRIEHEAVRAAADFLARDRELVHSSPGANQTELAVLAIEIHTVFLGRDEDTGEAAVIAPNPDAVRAALARPIGP
jgi:Fe-S-cluster containining protein